MSITTNSFFMALAISIGSASLKAENIDMTTSKENSPSVKTESGDVIITYNMSNKSKVNISEAVKFLKAACVLDEKYTLEVKGDSGLRFLRAGQKNELIIKKEEIRGFLSGVNDDLKSEQASEIRSCMKPYINKIINSYLGTDVLPKGSFIGSTDTRNTASQKIKYILITASKVKIIGDELHITLMFKCLSKKYGAALALYAEGSGGLADYWKFFPRPRLSEVIDNVGNKYIYKNSSGIGFAKTSEDWMTMENDSEHPVTFIFQKKGNKKTGSAFTLSTDIRLAYVSANGEQQTSAHTIYLSELVVN